MITDDKFTLKGKEEGELRLPFFFAGKCIEMNVYEVIYVHITYTPIQIRIVLPKNKRHQHSCVLYPKLSFLQISLFLEIFPYQ